MFNQEVVWHNKLIMNTYVVYDYEIDGQHYKVNNSISLSKINNIYQIDTFMSVASFFSDEFEYDDRVLKYVDSLRYAGKTDSKHLQEDLNLYISGSTCDLDHEFLKSDKIVENVLLNKTELDENDFSAFIDYEKGRKDSIEESMEICEETIDMYGLQLYKDIIQPLKENRLEIIPKLLKIIGED